MARDFEAVLARVRGFRITGRTGDRRDDRQQVRLDVYSIAGHLVRMLVDPHEGAGWHRLEWDGLDGRGTQTASGVYFYRMRAGDFEQTRKMVLVR
jgi:flagellar hook assembly protein FlgD